MSEREEAARGLIGMISLLERNGTLAHEVAADARRFVAILEAAPRQPDAGAERPRDALGQEITEERIDAVLSHSMFESDTYSWEIGLLLNGLRASLTPATVPAPRDAELAALREAINGWRHVRTADDGEPCWCITEHAHRTYGCDAIRAATVASAGSAGVQPHPPDE